MSRKVPRGSDDLICRWHKLPMSEVCHKCDHWMHVRGRNPNTGEDIDDWKCAESWAPIFLMSIVQKLNELGAAIESLRNEGAKAHEESMTIVMGAARSRAAMFPAKEPPRLIDAKNITEND
jgi:hypothetical protein